MNQTATDLQTKVRTAILNDPRIKAHGGIEVLDDNGVITLKGTAPSHEVSKAAEAIAGDVDGVTSVVNEMDVVSIGEDVMGKK